MEKVRQKPVAKAFGYLLASVIIFLLGLFTGQTARLPADADVWARTGLAVSAFLNYFADLRNWDIIVFLMSGCLCFCLAYTAMYNDSPKIKRMLFYVATSMYVLFLGSYFASVLLEIPKDWLLVAVTALSIPMFLFAMYIYIARVMCREMLVTVRFKLVLPSVLVISISLYCGYSFAPMFIEHDIRYLITLAAFVLPTVLTFVECILLTSPAGKNIQKRMDRVFWILMGALYVVVIILASHYRDHFACLMYALLVAAYLSIFEAWRLVDEVYLGDCFNVKPYNTAILLALICFLVILPAFYIFTTNGLSSLLVFSVLTSIALVYYNYYMKRKTGDPTVKTSIIRLKWLFFLITIVFLAMDDLFPITKSVLDTVKSPVELIAWFAGVVGIGMGPANIIYEICSNMNKKDSKLTKQTIAAVYKSTRSKFFAFITNPVENSLVIVMLCSGSLVTILTFIELLCQDIRYYNRISWVALSYTLIFLCCWGGRILPKVMTMIYEHTVENQVEMHE